MVIGFTLSGAVACGDPSAPPSDSLPWTDFAVLSMIRATEIPDDLVQPERSNAVFIYLKHLGPRLIAVGSMYDSVLGRTFEIADTADAYVPNDQRTDGPLDGVRFIVYEVKFDSISQAFRLEYYSLTRPLVELGYIDVTGASEGTWSPVRVNAVIGETVALEYTAEGANTEAVDSIICCNHAVAVAPRWATATGSIGLTKGIGSFVYSDSIRIPCCPYDYNVVVSERRALELSHPMGTIRISMRGGTSFNRLDSSSLLDLRIAVTGETGWGDSAIVDASFNRSRSHIGVDVVTLNGDTVYTYYAGWDSLGPDTTPLDSFEQRVVELVRRVTPSANSEFRLQNFEILLAPFLFVLHREAPGDRVRLSVMGSREGSQR